MGRCLDHERREMSEKRETVNAAMDQAIPRLAGNIATGRAEDSMLPPAKPASIGSNVQFGSQPRTLCQ